MPIRKNLAVHHDPYLPWGGLQKVAVCKRCGAVYRHKRWTMDGPLPNLKSGGIRSVLCPACRKVQDHFTAGVVTVEGEYWKDHREEILNLIRNQEARARAINPLERVIAIREQGHGMEIETTNERLAQRIGRELKRAYKGQVEYHWSMDDKQVRVRWVRG